MRPIDLLSSRYNSIKPKGHDGGTSRWRARPVMAAAILLLMSLAVLLPAMVLAQSANQAPTGLTAVPGDDEGSIQLDWNQSTDTTITRYEYTIREKDTTTTDSWFPIPNSACCDPEATTSENDDSYEIPADGGRQAGDTYEVKIMAFDTDGGTPSAAVDVKIGPDAVTGLAATAGHQSVTLEWSDDGEDVTHYEYRYKPGTNAWVKGPDRNDSATDEDYTYTVTGLTNRVEHTFQVRAYIDQPAEGGNPAIDAAGGAGEEATATPGTPAALGPVAAVGGYKSIRLAWADPMDSAITKYQYQVATTGTELSTVKWGETLSADVWKYTNAGGDSTLALLVDMTTGTDGADPEVPAADLADNTDYILYLRAVNGNGAGPASAELSARTLGQAGIPPTPATLTASPGDKSVTLNWTAITTYVGIGYQYCQKADTGEECAETDWQAIDSNFTTTSPTVTGLTNGTVYYFRVRAISSADNTRASGESNEESATPGLPSAPTNLKAIPGDAKFKLSWTASDANGSAIIRYEYNTNGVGWKPIAGSGTSALITKTSATVDIDLVTDATYTVRLRAVNDDGPSAESEELSVTTDNDPPAPTDLTATPGPGSGEVTLSWTAPVYLDVTSYAYQQDSGAETPVPDSDATTTSYTVTGLTNGEEYDFVVLAMNGTVASAPSNEVQNVIPGVPTAPMDLTADSGTAEKITLSWTAPAYAGTPALIRYEYRYTSVTDADGPVWSDNAATMTSGPWAATSDTIPPGTGTELTLPAAGNDKILEPGTVYYFQVRAVNVHGNGAESKHRQRRRNRRRSRLDLRDRDVGQRRQRHRDGRQQRQCRG